MSRFPLPINIRAVDLSVAIVTGYIWAEGSRKTRNQCLGIGNIEGGCNARHINQIAWPTKIAVESFASVETIDPGCIRFAGIAKAERSAASTVRYAESRFGVKGAEQATKAGRRCCADLPVRMRA